MTDRQKNVLDEFITPDLSYQLEREKVAIEQELYDFRDNMCTFITRSDLIRLTEPHKPVKELDSVTELPLEYDVLAEMVEAFGPYKLSDINLPFISLRHGEPGRCTTCKKTRGNKKCDACRDYNMCKVCKVVHESENPYLLVTPGRILFECRRSEDHVGKVTYQDFWQDPNYDPDKDVADMFSDIYSEAEATGQNSPTKDDGAAVAGKKVKNPAAASKRTQLVAQALTLSAWDTDTARKISDGEIQL